MRFRLSMTAAVLTSVLAFGAAALAGDSVKTKVKITEGGPNLFAGTVSSKEPKCEKGREVTLHYGEGESTSPVGTAKSDKEGNWELEGSFMAGEYHAEVSAKRAGKVKCRATRGLRAQF